MVRVEKATESFAAHRSPTASPSSAPPELSVFFPFYLVLLTGLEMAGVKQYPVRCIYIMRECAGEGKGPVVNSAVGNLRVSGVCIKFADGNVLCVCACVRECVFGGGLGTAQRGPCNKNSSCSLCGSSSLYLCLPLSTFRAAFRGDGMVGLTPL